MMSVYGDFQGNDAYGSSKNEAEAGSMSEELGFNLPASAQQHTVPARPLDEDDADCYDMAHPGRGTCVIFNNQVFHPHTNLPERCGSDKDEESLGQQFGNLGFRVHVHRDLTHRKLRAKLKQFPVNCVFEPFLGEACPSLHGKPKLFFIQACRGTQLDKGVQVACDKADSRLGAGPTVTDPDFLVAYSTVAGFYSFRNVLQGSWFVQALCAVLSSRGRLDHLLSMLTDVCRHVAIEYTSDAPRNRRFHKKQVPCVTSTLTRLLYFPPPQA